jgi:hypothetical protein
MHHDLKQNNITYSNEKNENKLSHDINNIIKFEDIHHSSIIENNEKIVNAKKKLLKQLSNIYKNTRLQKFTIECSPTSTQLEYKRVKGLVLNVQKRMCWYLNLDPQDVRCLLISIKARTANEDLIYDDRNKYFFDYYCKFFFTHENQNKFISIPLIDLNIVVV